MTSTTARDTAILTIEPGETARLHQIAAYAREVSARRGLTAGELADDLADRLATMAQAPNKPADDLHAVRPFLEILVRPLAAPSAQIHVDCDPALELRADELAPIGVVACEAIANAMRYAFPQGREGHIWVRVAQEEGRIRLTIRDNGVGMPDLSPGPFNGGGLIDALARQMGGFARLGSAPFGGALVTLVYPRA